jgi:hypothetical protein
MTGFLTKRRKHQECMTLEKRSWEDAVRRQNCESQEHSPYQKPTEIVD